VVSQYFVADKGLLKAAERSAQRRGLTFQSRTVGKPAIAFAAHAADSIASAPFLSQLLTARLPAPSR